MSGLTLRPILIEGNQYTSKSDATLEALKGDGVKTLTSQEFIYNLDENNLYSQVGLKVFRRKKVKHKVVETNNSSRKLPHHRDSSKLENQAAIFSL